MSVAAFAHATTVAPLKYCAQRTISAGKAIGHFMYGDDVRTHRSLCFAYACVAIYTLAIIDGNLISACVP